VPPRYAYWTILIDNQPTAFRSRDQEELLPTLNQLRRKNSAVVMKWFARGRLWDTPEQAQWARTNLTGSEEKRRKDWRPGGEHVDPRARFDRRKDDRWKKPAGTAKIVRPAEKKTFGPAEKKTFRPAGSGDKKVDRRWRDKKPNRAEGQRPWPRAGAAGGRPWRDGPSSGAARSGQQPPRSGPAAAKPARGPSRKDRG
jgi:hypothetical protein